MITSVIVTNGKVVINVPYHYLRLIGLWSAAMQATIIVYIFELFNLALDIKHRMGDYIDLLLENGIVLPMVTTVSGLIGLTYSIFTIFIVWKSFNSTNRMMSMLLFLNVILCLLVLLSFLVLICVALAYGHDTDPKYVEYLLEAMGNYSTDGLVKTKIDRLQFEFQCCGSRNYSDWYLIDWYDKNFVQKAAGSVYGEAPFSCCSIRSEFPCVHHGVERGWGAYRYTNEGNFSLSVDGCFNIIERKKKTMCWNVAGYIFALFVLNVIGVVPLRFIQTAHVERGKFDKENHLYTAWLLGCYGGKKRAVVKPPPPPPFQPDMMGS